MRSELANIRDVTTPPRPAAPYLSGALFQENAGVTCPGIVHRQHLLVRDDRPDGVHRCRVSDVVAEDEGRTDDGPGGEVGTRLQEIERAARLAECGAARFLRVRHTDCEGQGEAEAASSTLSANARKDQNSNNEQPHHTFEHVGICLRKTKHMRKSAPSLQK